MVAATELQLVARLHGAPKRQERTNRVGGIVRVTGLAVFTAVRAVALAPLPASSPLATGRSHSQMNTEGAMSAPHATLLPCLKLPPALRAGPAEPFTFRGLTCAAANIGKHTSVASVPRQLYL